MNKIILSLLMAGVAFSAIAQDNKAQSQPEFYGKEFNLSLATTYPIDTTKLFQNKYDVNLLVGGQVYLNKYVGGEVTVPIYRAHNTVFQEASVGVLLRLPVDRFSVYAGPGVNYSWTAHDLNYYAKIGGEVRVKQGVGLFGEATYQANEISSIKEGITLIAGGLRVSF